MRSRWKNLEDGMADMEQDMNDLGLNSQTLRDSISSVTSLDVRSHGGSGVGTPGSSPASSVVMPNSPVGVERKRSPAPVTRTPTGGSRPSPKNRASSIPKKSPYARLSSTGSVSGVSVRNPLSPTTPTSGMVIPRPTQGRRTLSTSAKSLDNRPRWNASTNTNDSPFGHNFKPLNLTTPSPYRKLPLAGKANGPTISIPTSPGSSGTRIPGPSPLSQGSTSLPGSPHLSGARRSSSGFLKSPSPSPRLAPAAGGNRHPELRRQASMSRLRDQSWDHARDSHFRTQSREQARRQSQDSATSSTISHSNYVEEKGREREERQDQRDKENAKRDRSRPASAMASVRGHRISMLPRPTTPGGGGGGGKRNSMPPGNIYGNAGQKAPENRPRWRG